MVSAESTVGAPADAVCLFERMFAPRVMRAIYADELKRLDRYAREHRSA